MIVLKHPVATYVILVSTTDAENFSFVGHKSSAKFGNKEIIEEHDLF